MSEPMYLLPLRKVLTPKLWSTISHKKKLVARDLHRKSQLTYNLYTDGVRLSLNPPAKPQSGSKGASK